MTEEGFITCMLTGIAFFRPILAKQLQGECSMKTDSTSFML
jgi:hypothetical protein